LTVTIRLDRMDQHRESLAMDDRRPGILGRPVKSRATTAIGRAPLVSKIEAAKNHARRVAFKFQIDKLARRALFDPIPQSEKLLFALRRGRSLGSVELVHGVGRDGAGYLGLIVHHRKQNDHAVVVVSPKPACGQRHREILSSASTERLDIQFFRFTGGSSSAIFERQSAWVAWGPVTNVPLTLVLYQPD
jgi:hypothetical protein